MVIKDLNNAVCQIFITNNIDVNIGFSQRDFMIGPCLVHGNTSCPDKEVTFFLYTRKNPTYGHEIIVNDTDSNLKDTNFNPKLPTKILIHGYNSNMQLEALVDIRNEYLKKHDCNIFAVDWNRLAAGPCYPIAVYNAPHVGRCLAQLIRRVLDSGAEDLHAIGFSLGAHVPGLAARELLPYKIPRITGLDPAMPLFVTVNNDRKLDKTDGIFVDVIHTNAFIQGKFESCGHLDIYMNGGITQPGCQDEKKPFGCAHHRAPEYFAESINSKVGFWGWACTGFIDYLIGYCPPKTPFVLVGDDVDKELRGYFIVKTGYKSPFAINESLIFDDYERSYREVRFRKKAG
ncbi:hypothetical protein PV328_008064 [Microctonus aethiopoides]|uniref:phospholipase A1 n=1 Tax=Microctonus aethiopoides TaxID=144406 RepID=A0AA39F059_9HYME|nr:hypothetical protein PV328_008064 [Microctonus aethiopoides]